MVIIVMLLALVIVTAVVVASVTSVIRFTFDPLDTSDPVATSAVTPPMFLLI